MIILNIGKVDEKLYSSIGGKAKGLDQLKKAGFNVPKGFIITDIDKLTKNDEKTLLKHFKKLNVKQVSVRSSASNEDGVSFSAAGQYETCLYITKENFIESVNKCLSSLHSERAQKYNETLLENNNSNHMNIVVQEMIDPLYAGVLFTSHPLNRRHMLLECVEGIGENLVNGTKESTRFIYTKKGEDHHENDYSKFNEKDIKKLIKNAVSIYNHFIEEIDLEWAIDKKHKIYWLQKRPITTFAKPTIKEFDNILQIENQLVTSRNIGEMMPGAVTPLTITTSVLAIDYGMRRMLKYIGHIKHVDDLADYSCAFSASNHLFINLTTIHTMTNSVAMASAESTNLSIAGDSTIENPPFGGKKKCLLIRLINSVKFGVYIFSSKKAKRRQVKINKKFEIYPYEDMEKLYYAIDGSKQTLFDVLSYHYICSSYSGAMNSALSIMLEKEFDEKSKFQAFMADLLKDIDGIESADILVKLGGIAKKLLEKEPNIKNLSMDEFTNYIVNLNDKEVKNMLDEFIIKHGHRSIKEAEIRSKSWKHDLTSLYHYIYTIIVSYKDNQTTIKFEMEPLLLLLKEKSRGAVKFLGKMARKAVVDREFSKSQIIKTIDKFKTAYMTLAKQLVKANLLEDEDLIYFLGHDEIIFLIKGDKTLNESAKIRRDLYKKQEEIQFENLIIGYPKDLNEVELDKTDVINGIPVSKGVVTGVAHIVKSIDDANELKEGEIMIAPFTDIGWSPYYSLIKGLVTEIGSTLSHGAVVAREYNLPTIVNAKNATRLISNGDIITLNGDEGIITINK